MSTVSSRSLVAGRVEILRSEWTWLALASAGIAVFYLALRAPALNPGTFTDPWFYTALMVNFKYLFHTFGEAYYPSRLPWLIPGIAAHDLFGPITAFFVLHAVFFFAGGLFAYLTVRHFFGSVVALASYVLLMASPLFYDMYTTDHPAGAILTFLFGGTYFAVTAHGARRPLLRAAAGGFLLAASVGTNLFAVVAVGCLLLLYVVVRVTSREALAGVGRELASGILGALALVVVCGTFSKVNGGAFLFFAPSVREAGYIDTADYKLHGYAWLYAEPQLLLPLFAVLAALLSCRDPARAWRSDARRRFALGAAAALGSLYAVLVTWEFAFTGDFLETPEYFSLFNVGLLFCAAAVLSELWNRWAARGMGPAFFVVVVAAAAALPILVTYGVEVAPIGRSAAVVSLALMACVLLLLVGGRRVRNPKLGLAGLVVVAAGFGFALNYAGAGSAQTSGRFVRGSYAENRRVLSVALQLVDFMRSNGLQNGVSEFWYNPGEDQNLNGIQSTYFWGITSVGLDMPRIDKPMRELLDSRRPTHLVLLCRRHSCRGGPAALRKAGLRPRPVAGQLLVSGSERVWARAYALGVYAAEKDQSTAQHFFVPAQAPFSRSAPSGVDTWSFGDGAPAGWTGDALDASRAAHGKSFETSTSPLGYELLSPTMKLSAGRYALYLRGKVLSGGLNLGVLDAGADKWIQQRLYWYGQQGFGTGWMVTPFRLSGPTSVQFILSNWVPTSASSRWLLDELRLVRTG